MRHPGDTDGLINFVAVKIGFLFYLTILNREAVLKILFRVLCLVKEKI